MRLQTPEKIRTLQRKLYLKAKAEPDFRFYLLYDKVYREDILFHAYRLARSNKGAPGVDGQSFEEIEAMGLEGWLSGIRDDLRAKTYRPEPVRRAMVPKPGGGERPLGIPTIRDRVVQGAVKLVIEPIFEADLEPSAYGYRPKRSAGDAVQAVHKLLCRGYTDVVDADLSKYFDTIPHAELMQSVARRIVDRNVLRLIKLWLKTPVEETDGDGKRRMTGGRGSTRGTPQGGIVSPLLAALYINRFLKYWRITGQGTRFRAEVVNYADDLVILSRGHAREALAWTRQVMTRLGLTLNEAKTGPRAVPLGKAARAIIDALPGKRRPGAFLLPKLAEGRYSHSLVVWWRTVCADAKLGRLRLHDLRHTAASHAVMSGENLPLVGKLLGHRRHRTTAGYAHLADSHLVEAAERVGSIIAAAMEKMV